MARLASREALRPSRRQFLSMSLDILQSDNSRAAVRGMLMDERLEE